MSIAYTPIGVIRTPHTAIKGMPIQPVGALGVAGTIEISEVVQNAVQHQADERFHIGG